MIIIFIGAMIGSNIDFHAFLLAKNGQKCDILPHALNGKNLVDKYKINIES